MEGKLAITDELERVDDLVLIVIETSLLLASVVLLHKREETVQFG